MKKIYTCKAGSLYQERSPEVMDSVSNLLKKSKVISVTLAEQGIRWWGQNREWEMTHIGANLDEDIWMEIMGEKRTFQIMVRNHQSLQLLVISGLPGRTYRVDLAQSRVTFDESPSRTVDPTSPKSNSPVKTVNILPM